MKNTARRRYTDTLTHKISYVVAIFLLLTYFGMASVKIAPQIANMSELDKLIYEIAPKYHLDPQLISAVIQVESQGNPHAISKAGAFGLMQIQIETARYYVQSSTITAQEIRDRLLNDQRWNIEVGCRHLRVLMDRALVQYSGGARGYVDKIKLAMRKEGD